ncbi:MAG TPA: coproporphyrinogen III oxidase, partial [Tistrella mobilis]|nr:coproporphyrinogen III oxidase [Tistrella mobilis]
MATVVELRPAVQTSPAAPRRAEVAQTALRAARLPRYTSYPTALQFDAAVGPDQAAAWMRAVPAG